MLDTSQAPSPQTQQRTTVDSQEWRMWLRAQLLDNQFAALGREGKVRYYLTDLEAAIARALPSAPVPLETLRNVVYRNALPSHHTARGLAAAFGVSELAILLHSGQLDRSAVEPLLGPVPAILRSEQEYMAEYVRLSKEIADPAFRDRLIDLLNYERQYSQWLESRLRWLGIPSDEWERIRSDLNGPDGRLRLVRAVYGPDASPDADMPPSLPQEFVDAAGNPDLDR
jgi:hypothetical protein